MKSIQKYRVFGIIIVAFIFFNVFLMSDSGYVDENNLIYSDATNGRVGIGTGSPLSLLHLKNSGTSTVLRIDGDGDNNARIYFSDAGTTLWNMGFSNYNSMFSLLDSVAGTMPLKIYSSAEENTLVINAGKVGIGTATPAGKLHVIGGSDVYAGGGGEIILGDIGSTNIAIDGNEIMARNNSVPSILHLNAEGGTVMIRSGDVEDKKVIFSSSGNVGIGTANPDQKLTVNGTIHAEKVIVNAVSADFVFENDYNLQPLSEVESFIDKNGHLPEIPSAKEVDAKGIELGEMNSKLLQKIEELTLYMIEQDKRIAELEKRLSGNE